MSGSFSGRYWGGKTSLLELPMVPPRTTQITHDDNQPHLTSFLIYDAVYAKRTPPKALQQQQKKTQWISVQPKCLVQMYVLAAGVGHAPHLVKHQKICGYKGPGQTCLEAGRKEGVFLCAPDGLVWYAVHLGITIPLETSSKEEGSSGLVHHLQHKSQITLGHVERKKPKQNTPHKHTSQTKTTHHIFQCSRKTKKGPWRSRPENRRGQWVLDQDSGRSHGFESGSKCGPGSKTCHGHRNTAWCPLKSKAHTIH